MKASGQRHALATSPWYQLNKRMGGPHSQSIHSEEKEITAPAGNQAPDCLNHSLLTYNANPAPTNHVKMSQHILLASVLQIYRCMLMTCVIMWRHHSYKTGKCVCVCACARACVCVCETEREKEREMFWLHYLLVDSFYGTYILRTQKEIPWTASLHTPLQPLCHPSGIIPFILSNHIHSFIHFYCIHRSVLVHDLGYRICP
jgi:hypothetical protein